jgi:hypothetical protein
VQGGATRGGGDVFIMVPAHSMHRVLNKIQYLHAINFSITQLKSFWGCFLVFF